MRSYTNRDFNIADDFLNACFSHFGAKRIVKIRGFVEMSYTRGKLTFNEYLACLDILKDKEKGL